MSRFLVFLFLLLFSCSLALAVTLPPVPDAPGEPPFSAAGDEAPSPQDDAAAPDAASGDGGGAGGAGAVPGVMPPPEDGASADEVPLSPGEPQGSVPGSPDAAVLSDGVSPGLEPTTSVEPAAGPSLWLPIGLVVLVLVIGGLFWYRSRRR